jgi:hypothetical protein
LPERGHGDRSSAMKLSSSTGRQAPIPSAQRGFATSWIALTHWLGEGWPVGTQVHDGGRRVRSVPRGISPGREGKGSRGGEMEGGRTGRPRRRDKGEGELLRGQGRWRRRPGHGCHAPLCLPAQGRRQPCPYGLGLFCPLGPGKWGFAPFSVFLFICFCFFCFVLFL